MQFIEQFRNSFAGKKSYLVSATMVVYGVSGFLLGELETTSSLMFVLNGLGMAAIRAGVAKTQNILGIVGVLAEAIKKLSFNDQNKQG